MAIKYSILLLLIFISKAISAEPIYRIGESYDFDIDLLNCDEHLSSKEYGDIFDVDYKDTLCIIDDEKSSDTILSTKYIALEKMLIAKIINFEKIEYDTLLSMLNSKYGSSRETKIRSTNFALLGYPDANLHEYKRVWKSKDDIVILIYTRMFDDKKLKQAKKEYLAELKKATGSKKQLVEAAWIMFSEFAKPTAKYLGYTNERVYTNVRKHVQKKDLEVDSLSSQIYNNVKERL